MAKKTINVIYKVDDKQLQNLKKTIGQSEAQSKALSNQLKDTGDKAKRAGQDGGKSFMDFNNIIKAISIVALTQQIISFSKEVIKVRGEFQKFEAVLTNTLGSKSAALIALGRINEFARTTPFSVGELTNSFIKLANRGVEPTIQEMRAIADLSATLGKDFDQVIEAILDINNPERWKEIGVKAETAGDKVTLSFRDARIEVDRTVRGVTDAVTALGQLNGVAGSTEAISGTLAGQMANLSDAWDQFLNTIGQGNQGVLSDAVSLLNQAIEAATKLLSSKETRFQNLLSQTLAAEVEEFKRYVDDLGSIEAAQRAMEERRIRRMQEISDKQTEILKVDEDELFGLEKTRHKEEKERLMFLYDIYDTDLPKAIEETVKSLNKVTPQQTVGIIERLRKEIEALNGEIEKTTREGDLGSQGRLIKELNERRKLLEEYLGKTKETSSEVADYLAYLSEQEMFNTRAILKDKQKQREQDAEREKEMAKNSADLQEYFRQLRIKKEKETEEEAIRIAEDAAERKRRIEEDLHFAAFRLARALVDFSFSSREAELQGISEFYDEQMRLAGNNERARAEIEVKRERALQKAREEEKQEEKKRARLRIIAETAVNVVEAFPNAFMMALAASLGVLQLGTVQRLRTGGWVKGPGTETSDSIPILASKNEFMVNADAAKRSPKLLEAINSKKLTDHALHGLARDGGSTFDNEGIKSELRNVVKELQANRPGDVVERHGRLMRATKRSRDYVQYVRARLMGDF